jgi:sortase A
MQAGRIPRRASGRLLTAAGLVLVAVGLAVAGGVGWQTWVASPLAASQQERAAAAQSKDWAGAQTSPSAAPGAGSVPVGRAPRFAGTVAVLVVPRFGSDWSRVVRQGVDEDAILNSIDAGVGHYEGTAMPGGVGNFAIAAHDTGYGDAFRHVGRLRIGDPIYLQTREGWYTYRFRNFQWVQPTEVGVIGPVPESAGTAPTGRVITLTTCDPPFNAQEREIAYGTFVRFTPGAEPPAGAA